jgi:DNA-binding NtrC family response regulator
MGGIHGRQLPDETILVVDDAESIRKMVCAMLTQNGYACLEAADGAEALRLLERNGDVHLVLTDMVMPRMGGADLAKRLSSTRPELRIVFMSGYTDDVAVRSVERTASIFLPKPFTAAALTEKIRQALDEPWRGLPPVWSQ